MMIKTMQGKQFLHNRLEYCQKTTTKTYSYKSAESLKYQQSKQVALLFLLLSPHSPPSQKTKNTHTQKQTMRAHASMRCHMHVSACAHTFAIFLLDYFGGPSHFL